MLVKRPLLPAPDLEPRNSRARMPFDDLDLVDRRPRRRSLSSSIAHTIRPETRSDPAPVLLKTTAETASSSGRLPGRTSTARESTVASRSGGAQGTGPAGIGLAACSLVGTHSSSFSQLSSASARTDVNTGRGSYNLHVGPSEVNCSVEGGSTKPPSDPPAVQNHRPHPAMPSRTTHAAPSPPSSILPLPQAFTSSSLSSACSTVNLTAGRRPPPSQGPLYSRSPSRPRLALPNHQSAPAHASSPNGLQSHVRTEVGMRTHAHTRGETIGVTSLARFAAQGPIPKRLAQSVILRSPESCVSPSFPLSLSLLPYSLPLAHRLARVLL